MPLDKTADQLHSLQSMLNVAAQFVTDTHYVSVN